MGDEKRFDAEENLSLARCNQQVRFFTFTLRQQGMNDALYDSRRLLRSQHTQKPPTIMRMKIGMSRKMSCVH